MENAHVLCGDSGIVLGHFSEGSFDAVITDPPHGLLFMGAEWDADLPAQAIWNECFRVLKPGAHILVMSSERVGCVAGLYMALKRAGFEVDESQLLCWVSLTGMPKSVDVAKIADKEAFRAWLSYVGAEVTPEERRKAESAAVNGEYRNPAGTSESRGNTYSARGTYGLAEGIGDTALLARLLALHWPSSPAEQRAHWEAVLGEVPEGWDCTRPPGVRVRTGGQHPYAARRPNVKVGGGVNVCQEGGDIGMPMLTAPSTPDAVRFDGLRGSVAPLKPFAYPILHAHKPREGSYLANLRAHGVGAWNVEEARVPFDEGQGSGVAPWGKSTRRTSREWAPGSALHDCDMEPIPAHSAGRSPSNLLSYADLLGDLQRYCDLDAWCERLGLPDAAADLLEAGLVYAPKPSRAEKEAGLEADKPPAFGNDKGDDLGRGISNTRQDWARGNTHPTAKPAALCAYLVALATREGQTVLDPFCGSGSTGVACARLGRRFVGVELSEDFAAIARARITEAERATAGQGPRPRQLGCDGGLFEDVSFE